MLLRYSHSGKGKSATICGERTAEEIYGHSGKVGERPKRQVEQGPAGYSHSGRGKAENRQRKPTNQFLNLGKNPYARPHI